MAPTSSCARQLSKATTLYNGSRTSSVTRPALSRETAIASQQSRTITTASPATAPTQPDTTRTAILRRRRHMPSSPQTQPQPNTTRFIITTKSSYFGQTEIERHFHGALTCLHKILGDVPYGRTPGAVSRTPIQMLPQTGLGTDGGRGSLLAFKVFNASGELREMIERELREVPGIDGVRCEEAGVSA